MLLNETTSLTAKVAIVTGATSGIGAVISRAYARAGADVILTGRRAELGTAVAAEIGGHFVPGDLTDQTVRRAVVEAAIQRFGRLDILVNNAATLTVAPTDNAAEDDFDQILALNLKAAYFLTQKAIPHLIGSRGTIINIGTLGAVRSWPGGSVYNASKAALESLTRSWAVEYGPQGVNVNSISPGMVQDAPMSQPVFDHVDVDTVVVPTIPARRLCGTDDVAAAALFLAGPGSEYLHGTRIALDGGATA